MWRCFSTCTYAAKLYRLDLDALQIVTLKSKHNLLIGTARCIAAAIISKWWKLKLMRSWMDKVLHAAVRLHAFPHRFNTNYKPWDIHFHEGINSIQRIMHTNKFTPRLLKMPQCPCCKTAPLEAAWYRRIGCKMARSTPHIDVGCATCLQFLGCDSLSDFFDSSDALATFYNGSFRASRIMWFASQDC